MADKITAEDLINWHLEGLLTFAEMCIIARAIGLVKTHNRRNHNG